MGDLLLQSLACGSHPSIFLFVSVIMVNDKRYDAGIVQWVYPCMPSIHIVESHTAETNVTVPYRRSCSSWW